MEEKKIVPVELEFSQALGREIRNDPLSEIGKSTWIKLEEAIKAGEVEEALKLAKYLHPEGKDVHDLFCDWAYANHDFIARNFGEEEIPKMLRSAIRIISSGVSKGATKLSVEESVIRYAEIARAHWSGLGEAGHCTVKEDEEKYVMTFDPCGSGGRLRRGSEFDGTPPRTEPPFILGKTSKAYPWSWSKAGVPYYCIHCCVWQEQIPIETLGYPLIVTEFPDDPQQPCRYIFYKKPELIPEECFSRVGKVKDVSKFKVIS